MYMYDEIGWGRFNFESDEDTQTATPKQGYFVERFFSEKGGH